MDTVTKERLQKAKEHLMAAINELECVLTVPPGTPLTQELSIARSVRADAFLSIQRINGVLDR